MKLNEHPRCSCKACRRGAATKFGKAIHRAVNRAIRHQTKTLLHTLQDFDAFEPVRISTGYTD